MDERFDDAPLALEAEWASVAEHYRSYAEPLRRFVRRVAADRGLSESLVDAEGVVHETFLSMLGSCDRIEAPGAWLFTVARRLVGKIAAQHQHRRADGDPQELAHSGAARWTSLVPSAGIEETAEARRVLESIAELSDRQKIAVYLRHIEGWSTAEIGDYLDCAPATASVHIHRGTQRVRADSEPAGRYYWSRSPRGMAGLAALLIFIAYAARLVERLVQAGGLNIGELLRNLGVTLVAVVAVLLGQVVIRGWRAVRRRWHRSRFQTEHHDGPGDPQDD